MSLVSFPMPDLRVLASALAAAGGVADGEDTGADTGDQLVAGPRGYAYACGECDVLGFVTANEPRACWSCGSVEHLVAR